MPLFYMKVGEVVKCFIGKNGSLIETYTDEPTLQDLMALSKNELKTILDHATLKVSNFNKCEKERLCELLLNSWELLMEKINKKYEHVPTLLRLAPSSSSASSDNTEDNAIVPTERVVKVKVEKDTGFAPLFFEVIPNKTLISNIYELYEVETNTSSSQVQFMFNQKRADSYRRVVEYMETPFDETVSFQVQPLLHGGGKRASSGTTKGKNKEEKKADLEENINSTIARIEAQSPSPFVIEVIGLFKVVLKSVNENPDTVFQEAIKVMSVQQLKRVQLTMHTGNVDFKVGTLSKEFFNKAFVIIETQRRQQDLLQRTMSDCMHLMLVTELGSEDASISWAGITKLLVNEIEEKCKKEANNNRNANMSG